MHPHHHPENRLNGISHRHPDQFGRDPDDLQLCGKAIKIKIAVSTKPIYLVDASIYIFRAYYSIPPTFVTKAGEAVNAVYGYTNFLLDLLENNPEHISCAFDESLNTCYRNRIYREYKANRDLPDANLEFQLASCQEITALMGIHSVCLHDYEADDIIGTLQKQLAGERPAIIVTRDKDLGQLLRAEDLLWDFAADAYAGPAEIKAKFGVDPDQIADYLALAGDTVDNIPGAKGVGAKSAAVLLNHFGDIEGLYERIEEIEDIGLRGAKKIKATLIEQEAMVRMFRRITSIMCDIQLEVGLEDLRPVPVDSNRVADFCQRMNFSDRLKKRVAGLTRGASA